MRPHFVQKRRARSAGSRATKSRRCATAEGSAAFGKRLRADFGGPALAGQTSRVTNALATASPDATRPGPVHAAATRVPSAVWGALRAGFPIQPVDVPVQILVLYYPPG